MDTKNDKKSAPDDAQPKGGTPEAERPDGALPDGELPDYERPTMYFEKEPELGRGAAAWMGVGIEFAAYVVLFFLAGKWLDGKFGWKPWGAAMGGMLGAFLGMYMLIRRATRLSE